MILFSSFTQTQNYNVVTIRWQERNTEKLIICYLLFIEIFPMYWSGNPVFTECMNVS